MYSKLLKDTQRYRLALIGKPIKQIRKGLLPLLLSSPPHDLAHHARTTLVTTLPTTLPTALPELPARGI